MLFGTDRTQAAGWDAKVQAALQEWKDATRYFESVRDPELIDYAVYGMEAARRKYMFLLKHEAEGKT